MNIFECLMIDTLEFYERDYRVCRATLTVPGHRAIHGPLRPNQSAAVHAALEAYHGDAFPEPFPDHFQPIVEHVVAINRGTTGMIQYLSKLVAGGRRDLDLATLVEQCRDFVEQQCRELDTAMAGLVADPLARTVREHPIWLLAECTAREGMRRCEQVKRKFGAPIAA